MVLDKKGKEALKHSVWKSWGRGKEHHGGRHINILDVYAIIDHLPEPPTNDVAVNYHQWVCDNCKYKIENERKMYTDYANFHLCKNEDRCFRSMKNPTNKDFFRVD